MGEKSAQESVKKPSSPIHSFSPLIADKVVWQKYVLRSPDFVCGWVASHLGLCWQSLVLYRGLKKASRGGLVHPRNSCGQGAGGDVFPEPEVWDQVRFDHGDGQADRWRSQPRADSVCDARGAWLSSPTLLGPQGIWCSLTHLSTCLRPLPSGVARGRCEERKCFSAPSAPTLQGTLSSQHSARGACNRKVTARMKSQGHGRTDNPERGR